MIEETWYERLWDCVWPFSFGNASLRRDRKEHEQGGVWDVQPRWYGWIEVMITSRKYKIIYKPTKEEIVNDNQI